MSLASSGHWLRLDLLEATKVRLTIARVGLRVQLSDSSSFPGSTVLVCPSQPLGGRVTCTGQQR